MKQYQDLLRDVLVSGESRRDRTGVGTLAVFGRQARYDLAAGFPLVTTKRVHWKSVVHELLWFLRGETNIGSLLENGVSIWSDWPHARYVRETGVALSLKAFEARILSEPAFREEWGGTGRGYGVQWRRWLCPDGTEIDQVAEVVRLLRTDPASRRILMSAWNPADVGNCSLPPCHAFWQWDVTGAGLLNCSLYQRSADAFLGVPFNIASAALLTHMLAQSCGLGVGEFVHSMGNLHVYSNHLDQVREQLAREPRPLPRLRLNPEIRDIDGFRAADIHLDGYDPHPAIKAQVAV